MPNQPETVRASRAVRQWRPVDTASAGFPLDQLGSRLATGAKFSWDIARALLNSSHIYPQHPANQALTPEQLSNYRKLRAAKGYVKPGTAVPRLK